LNLSILIREKSLPQAEAIPARKGKPSLGIQKYSRPEKVNPPQAEVFPARKSKPSSGRSIPGQEK
jgi:hypothetical protein